MTKRQFICNSCGNVYSRWMGQCEVCKSWNSIIEQILEDNNNKSIKHEIKVLDDFFVSANNTNNNIISNRHKTKLEEVNRVLGGGLVDSSVILLGGAPGVGKSTLLLQILSGIDGIEHYIYVSAEESIGQVLLRAQRLSISNDNLKIASASCIEQILEALKSTQSNSIVIIDSIQTVYSNTIVSPPGSIAQVKYCTSELVNFAKSKRIILIIVGHVTKDGIIAGPKTLEHMVDVVLSFEGDKTSGYRILRGEKNRFGAVDEIGVFTINNNGLQEVLNPSSLFLSDHSEQVSGISVFSGIEGTRPILMEVQALVSVSGLQIPKRSSVGFDFNRLALIIAVLTNKCRVSFATKDIFVNIAGGMKISETAADLAVAAAILSSTIKCPLPSSTVFFGEISLSGDIRPANMAFTRLKEATKLGFKNAYCSSKTENILSNNIGINITTIKSIKELSKLIYNNKKLMEE
ncbi:MAG: DNA repair protein RadA [Alphaproteobacteria bacterium]|nr:DNA repair protein RadA [Alphaproteobacteria bacterium]